MCALLAAQCGLPWGCEKSMALQHGVVGGECWVAWAALQVPATGPASSCAALRAILYLEVQEESCAVGPASGSRWVLGIFAHLPIAGQQRAWGLPELSGLCVRYCGS